MLHVFWLSRNDQNVNARTLNFFLYHYHLYVCLPVRPSAGEPPAHLPVNLSVYDQVTTRKSNHILLISGRTGKAIGSYYKTPDEKETYMSPVIHTRRDGSQYVLIGIGGETVGGKDIWFYSFSSFFFYSSTVYLEVSEYTKNVICGTRDQ